MKATHASTQRTLARALASCAAVVALLGAGSAHAAPVVYGEIATLKVKPKDPPKSDSGVGLSAARNEFVSFQVVIHGNDTGAKNVRAALGGLSGPSTIGGGDIRLYREAYLTTNHASDSATGTGTFPDALVPDNDEIANEGRNAFPITIPAGESRVVWVDVHVPTSAAPGVYTGSVAVTGDGLNASVPVTLTVVDAELPSTASLPTIFRIAGNQVCEAHTGNSECSGADAMYALMGKYEQMALEHRITLANIVPKVPGNGDWSFVDNAIGPYMDGTAPNRLAGAKMTAAQYQGPADANQLTAFANHFKQKGWFDRAFDYTADEPPYGSSFENASSRASVVKSVDPKFKTLVTTTIDQAQSHGLDKVIDLMVPVVNYVDGLAAPYQGDQRSHYDGWLQTPGKSMWVYQSCMSHGCAYGTNNSGGTNGAGWPSYMVDASAAKNRAMEWVAFLERAGGELYYETAQALNTAWTDQYQFNGNGDGTLFYPGTTTVIGGKSDVPVASMRLKYIRQSEQDYEWLKMVSDAGDPAFAQKLARALIPTAHEVGDDGAAFDRARLQLISRYLELTHKGLPPNAANAPGAPPLNPSDNPNALASNDSHSGGGCASGGAALALPGLLAAALMLRRRRR